MEVVNPPRLHVQRNLTLPRKVLEAIYQLCSRSARQVHLRPGLSDMLSREKMAFGFLLILVMAISVHDTVLIVVNHQIISDMEQNPIGVWLLSLNDGSVWPFVFLKLAGTSLVGAVLITIYRRHKEIGFGCTVGLAAIQVSLLLYLSFM